MTGLSTHREPSQRPQGWHTLCITDHLDNIEIRYGELPCTQPPERGRHFPLSTCHSSQERPINNSSSPRSWPMPACTRASSTLPDMALQMSLSSAHSESPGPCSICLKIRKRPLTRVCPGPIAATSL